MSAGLIEGGIFEALDDAGIAAAAPGGVHRRKAPQGTGDETIIIFSFEDGADVKVLTGTAWLNTTVQVKAVCEGLATGPADDAYAVAHTLLEDQALVSSGIDTMYLRRFGLFSYDEDVEGGKTYQHVGGQYRVMVIPS